VVGDESGKYRRILRKNDQIRLEDHAPYHQGFDVGTKSGEGTQIGLLDLELYRRHTEAL
jgi:hypothetical protein